MTTHYSSASEQKTPQHTGNLSLIARALQPDLAVAGLFALCLVAVSVGFRTINEVLILNEVRAALHTILVSLTGMAIFYVVFLILFAVIYRSFLRRIRHPAEYTVVVGLSFLALVALGSVPITAYIENHGALSGSVFLMKSAFLAMSNALLYVTIFGLLKDTKAEAGNTYVISAKYKDTDESDYLFEKIIWIILSKQQSIFYYIVSFTLFTDKMLSAYVISGDGQRGIVGALFDELLNNGWTMLFTVQLLAFMVAALSVRAALGVPVRLWERARHLAQE